MPHNPLSWKRHRCAALGDERFGGGEAGGFQLLAEFRLDFVDIFRAVLVGETRALLERREPIAFCGAGLLVQSKKLPMEILRGTSAGKEQKHREACLAH